MASFKTDFPLVSTTQFDVAPVAIADETGYTSPVNAGSGDWVLGSILKLKGRRLLVTVNTGAASGSPGGFQVALYGSATDANGTSGAIITATAQEELLPVGDITYEYEIDLAYVTDLTKYYSMGVALKGGGATTLVMGTTSRVLDPLVRT